MSRSRSGALPASALLALLMAVPARAQQAPAAAAEPPSPSAARAPVILPAVVRSFVPTRSFDGRSLEGWRAMGGRWRAENGEIVGTLPEGGAGWLVLDQPYQDVAFTTSFRCSGCSTGLLLRGETTGDQTSGFLFSLGAGEMGVTRVTLDAAGRITDRQPITAPAPPAPAPTPPANPAPPPQVGLGNLTVAQLGRPRATAALRPAGEWNHVEFYLNSSTARAVLNGAGIAGGNLRSSTGYGRVALYVTGAPGTEVRFREIGVKDLGIEDAQPVERTSADFRKRQIEDVFYTEAITTADMDRDGNLDIVSGPWIYLGPEFTRRREIFVPVPFTVASYPDPLWTGVADVTGDGYPDLFNTGTPGRPIYLHVNPGPVNRRWERHEIVPTADTEIIMLEDLDGDRAPELIYGDGGFVGYAKPGPDPTKPWTFHPVTEKGPWGAMYAYGMGMGDLNGDGRQDIVQAYGWWEQPATRSDAPWTYHPQAFGRWGTQQGGAGGTRPFVYDVNGDGLNDLVTGLEAHGWGLAWYEQKKDARGGVSWQQHMIMDDFANPNEGVAFSIIHSMALADVDGDGLQDIVTGKRWWGAFGENPNDPDYWGPAVLYWFKLVREGGGRARYVPQLIDNNSGVGNQIATADLNRDGRPDVLTATRRGTFLFLSQRGAAGTAR